MSSDSSLLSNTLSNHTKSDNEPIERGRNENSFYESNDSEFIEEEMIILVSILVRFMTGFGITVVFQHFGKCILSGTVQY